MSLGPLADMKELFDVSASSDETFVPSDKDLEKEEEDTNDQEVLLAPTGGGEAGLSKVERASGTPTYSSPHMPRFFPSSSLSLYISFPFFSHSSIFTFCSLFLPSSSSSLLSFPLL